ncbi:hypothetical protein [Dictyobacter alpinus]|nr:hypothetical protein [Dictyobacter alpinus]
MGDYSQEIDITVYGHTVQFTQEELYAFLFGEVMDVWTRHPEWTCEQLTAALVEEQWGVYEEVWQLVIAVDQARG